MIARGCRAKIERRELPKVSSNQQECLARAFGADRGLVQVDTPQRAMDFQIIVEIERSQAMGSGQLEAGRSSHLNV